MTATRRPHQKRVRTDVDRLIDAACIEFGKRGFREVTMADVALTARCTKPTLYAHFGSKDALLAAALEREADRCRTWLFTRYEEAAALPMREELIADIDALFDYVAAHPDGFDLLFGGTSAGSANAARVALLAEITDQVSWRLHAHNPTRRGSPGRTERQLAATVVNVSFTGAQFAGRTSTSLSKARATATDFIVGAITTMAAQQRAR